MSTETSTPEKLGCPHAVPDLDRARIMANEGSDVFTDFVADFVNENQSLVTEMLEQNALVANQGFAGFVDAVSVYIRDDGSAICETREYESVNRLKAELSGILEWTDDAQFEKLGVKDSIYFATRFIGGMATRVSEVLNSNIKSSEPLDVLRREDFQSLVERMSKAPFLFYGGGPTVDVVGDVPGNVSRVLFEGSSHYQDVFVVNERGKIEILPEVEARLGGAIKENNKAQYLIDHEILKAPGSDIASSSGCPVSRAPRGAEKSGIAMWCDFLADQYERYLALTSGQIGRAAFRSVIIGGAEVTK